ncbi:rubredoxin [Desulfotomaculum copahuensis]|uniref:rubredoxin n=1 Tax=Desulfotomaculum copahuensis TaxID=1838280 RepID=UPI000990024B|nr:rubredoxin [Desulfotomaculum copahuensis]
MKKWICSVCGHVYDPEKDSPPGETAGAAVCSYVDGAGEIIEGFTCVQCGAKKEALKESEQLDKRR